MKDYQIDRWVNLKREMINATVFTSKNISKGDNEEKNTCIVLQLNFTFKCYKTYPKEYNVFNTYTKMHRFPSKK